MAVKNVACTDLAMAYSSRDWTYSTDGTAYAGFAGGTLYGVTILRFTVPAFSGLSEALKVGLVMRDGMGDDVTLRWALCTSDANRDDYKNTADQVADENQADTGTVFFKDMTEYIGTRNFELPTKCLKPGTWYLILWAAGSTGVSLREVSGSWGEHSVSLDYKSGGARIRTAEGVKMFGVYSGAKKFLIPYIKTESGIKPVS